MRKGPIRIRTIDADPTYQSVVVAKLINYAMRHGKKLGSSKQVYLAMSKLKSDSKQEPLIVLEQALDAIKPKVEVRPRRIGGAVYQVPTPVRGNRQLSLAIRWLVSAARSKDNKQYHTFSDKLGAEINAALKNEGSAIAKRLEVEKMADANKAFAHLRW